MAILPRKIDNRFGARFCWIESFLQQFHHFRSDNVSVLLNQCSSLLLGDVNQDGSVDALDVQPFVDLLIAGEFQAEANINQDGAVALLDVDPFVELLADG